MKKLLFVIYFITIADAYYSTLFVEPKTPPQYQTAQVSVQSTMTQAQLR
ncbi:hypothetical protein AAGS61_08380 [Lysinibacillus sp. KU-BSD001]